MTASHAEPAADDAIRAVGLRVTGLASSRVRRPARCTRTRRRTTCSIGSLVTVPGTSLQSVYNALSDFADAGLVRRIEPAGHPGLFELRVSDNHHHLICSDCGAVEDVDCVVGEAPCLTPVR